MLALAKKLWFRRIRRCACGWLGLLWAEDLGIGSCVWAIFGPVISMAARALRSSGLCL
jgi:hypothetical protein